MGGALQHLKTRLLAPSDAGTGKDGEACKGSFSWVLVKGVNLSYHNISYHNNKEAILFIMDPHYGNKNRFRGSSLGRSFGVVVRRFRFWVWYRLVKPSYIPQGKEEGHAIQFILRVV